MSMIKLNFQRNIPEPVKINFIRDDTARIKEFLSGAGYHEAEIDQLVRGYNIVSIARNQLGIK